MDSEPEFVHLETHDGSLHSALGVSLPYLTTLPFLSLREFKGIPRSCA